MSFVGRGFTGCGKKPHSVILSEARNLSSIKSPKKEGFLGKLHASE